MVRRFFLILVAVCGLLLAFAGPAGATWSIVAIDEETGAVGGVMASCVDAGVLGEQDEVLVPLVLLPGVGGGVSQGTIDATAPAALSEALLDGLEPQAAIDELLEGDELSSVRQYGAVALPVDGSPAAAGFTGNDVGDVALVVTDGAAVAQGTLVSESEVVTTALETYSSGRDAGQSMEEALVSGLLAGSELGGDRRCGDQTALFAHVAVVEPGDDPRTPPLLLTVTVNENDGQNPVSLLEDSLADGRTGWIDAGAEVPMRVAQIQIPRIAVGLVAFLLALAAVFVLRRGVGTPSARR